MATIKQIQFKRSPTAGKVPTTAQVAEGELALNLNDKIIYTGDGTSVIEMAQGFRGELPTTANLDAYGPGPATRGVWSKAGSANSSQANGFPEENAVGVLEVFSGGQYGGSQRYTVRSGNIYTRSLSASWNGTNGPWNEWRAVGGSARGLSASINLNDLGNASDLGIWRNNSSTLATLALGYPEEGSNCQGVLEVLEGGGYNRTQRYTTRTGSIYVRNLSANWNPESPSWEVWKSVGYQVAGAYFTGDLNDLTDPGKYSVTSTASNLPMVITGIVEVSKRLDGVNVEQEFTTTGSGSTTRGRKFTRVKSGAGTGTWGPWDEIYTETSLQLNLGIGKNVIELPSLDWQTFDFKSGAIYGVANTTMTNVPDGVIIADVSYYVNIVGKSGNAIEYQLTARTSNDLIFRVQYIRSSGAPGSRTFYVRELASTSNTNTWKAAQTFSDVIVNGNTKNSSITLSKTNAGTSTVNDIVMVASGDSLATPAGTVRNRFEIKDSVNNLISLTRRTNNALEATVEGTIRANEFVSTAANSYRILGSEYGSFIRNSGSYTYFLLTNKDAQSGTYNALRPITIHNPSGRVDFGNGISLTSNNTFSIGTGSSIKFNGDAANVWDISTSTDKLNINYTGTTPATSVTTTITKEGDFRGPIWNKYSGATSLANVFDTKVFLKADNLSGIQDRAAAWLNVRPLGSTPLAGDGVGDYDAVTMRQLRNSSGGTGPSMNGVMNYGVGSFHLTDSRAFLQRYEVFSDGQLLNRADYPDLWAFAQLHSPITDSVWLADWGQRGKYSSGNGTTTFRVPDRNGVQPDSIRSLFGRGDGGNSVNNGEIRQSSLPNITGLINFHGSGTGAFSGTVVASMSGAFRGVGPIGRYINGSTLVNANANSFGAAAFNAAEINPVYNRYPELSDEVLPRNFTGVWTIRASGGFTAANTSWSVINGDAVNPPNGTVVLGGSIDSKYLVAGQDKYRSSFQMYGQNEIDLSTRITTINDNYPQGAATWDFRLNGRIVANKGLITTGTSEAAYNTAFSAGNVFSNGTYSGYAGIAGGAYGDQNGNYRNYVSLGAVAYPSSSSVYPRALISQVFDYNPATGSQPNGALIRNTEFRAESFDILFGTNDGTQTFLFSKSPLSDKRLKHNIKSIDTASALENISKMEYTEYVYNHDEKNQVRRGFIAQQLQAIDKQYVRAYKNAVDDEVLSLDENVLLLDALAAIKELLKKVAELEAKIK